jgi:hypothetical protein
MDSTATHNFIVTVVDTAMSANLDSLAHDSFFDGALIAMTTCFLAAAVILLGLGIMRAVSSS